MTRAPRRTGVGWLNGLHVFLQSVTFAPGVNALGLITSNGVNLGLGNL